MRRALAVGAVLVLSAAALGAKSALTVKGLGKAEIRFNSVRYRAELMEQLQPGLTWRLGKDDATRLTLEKMALVGADAILLPGEMTLNLRFWDQRKWELVVYEEDDWKWSEDKTEFAVVTAVVGKPTDTSDEKKGKSLRIDLTQTTRGATIPIERPTVTGDAELLDLFEVPDDVEYDPPLRKRWEALRAVDLRMWFGPNAGTVRFEPAAVQRLEGAAEGGAKLVLDVLQLAAPAVRTSFLEEHEGELPIAVWHEGTPAGAPALVTLSGGESPILWLRSRNGKDELSEITGTRVEVQRKNAATIESVLEDGRLTIRMSGVDYVFRLGGGGAVTPSGDD